MTGTGTKKIFGLILFLGFGLCFEAKAIEVPPEGEISPRNYFLGILDRADRIHEKARLIEQQIFHMIGLGIPAEVFRVPLRLMLQSTGSMGLYDLLTGQHVEISNSNAAIEMAINSVNLLESHINSADEKFKDILERQFKELMADLQEFSTFAHRGSIPSEGVPEQRSLRPGMDEELSSIRSRMGKGDRARIRLREFRATFRAG